MTRKEAVAAMLGALEEMREPMRVLERGYQDCSSLSTGAWLHPHIFGLKERILALTAEFRAEVTHLEECTECAAS